VNASASAESQVSGKVTSVNEVGHFFTVHWTIKRTGYQRAVGGGLSREKIFKTTDKTIYMLGTTKLSWSDLKKGSLVKVTAHQEGSETVADNVELSSEINIGKVLQSIQDTLLRMSVESPDRHIDTSIRNECALTAQFDPNRLL
jgi:hypothetical protein